MAATNETFAERLARLMAERHFNVIRLERASGIYRSNIHNWLDDRCFPRPDNLARLAHTLHTSVFYLATGEQEKTA